VRAGLGQAALASPAPAPTGRPMQPANPGLTSGLPWGQYLATAANAFDHSVKRRVLAIDWIVRITRQVLLRGHLIGPRLAVADRCLRQQLVVRVRRWRWCGWISRTSRLRNRHRSVDQGQQRHRRDQLSHDGSHELGPLSRFMVGGRLDHKVPKPHVSFRCSKRAGFGPALYASPGAVRRVSFSVSIAAHSAAVNRRIMPAFPP
jgi:hypothetical protein